MARRSNGENFAGARAGLCVALACAGGVAVAAPTPQTGPDAPARTAIRLVTHRAVYDLSLERSGGTRAIEGAAGRIVIDFSGDACKGYTMQTRQVTVLTSGETGERTSDLRSSTFESGDGTSLRFKTASLLDGKPMQSVDGTAGAEPDALKVRIREPKRDRYTFPGEVLFPSHHLRRLIEAARAGETTLAVAIFDGSDDGRKVYDTLAVIGRPGASPNASVKPDGDAPERDRPLREGDLASVRRWPVVLSYFTRGEGERTPILKLGFDLYENGISAGLRLDYGGFVIVGDMTRLDLAKPDPRATSGCEK